MASPSERISASPPARGIGCRVGKAEIVLPFETVGLIIEYPVFPLPLARPWIGGLGLHDDQPLVSVDLKRTGDRSRAVSRMTRGILLASGGAQIRWALEVDELGTFVDATVRPRAPAPGLDLPPWISQATTQDGRVVAWIDVGSMRADLEGGAPR